jgi:carboxylesterase type B
MIIQADNMTQQSFPVYIYIHGGGYQAGSGYLVYPELSENFLSTGVIVVSINYRLNAFGKLLCVNEVDVLLPLVSRTY